MLQRGEFRNIVMFIAQSRITLLDSCGQRNFILLKILILFILFTNCISKEFVIIHHNSFHFFYDVSDTVTIKTAKRVINCT